MRSTILFVIAACGGGGGGGKPATQVPTATPPKTTEHVSAASVEGYWTGDWGQLLLGERAGKLVGAYSHDEGMIVGAMQNGVLVGWWCEVPSRKAPKDAGEVEMRFITNDEGKRAIDGRWRYGSEGVWKEDWDIAWDTGTPDSALVKRLDAAATDCVK